MRISEAKDCIKALYESTNSVTALISERGVGKTSAYQQCAKELGIGYIGLYAAALEGPDFMGLPDKDRESGITRYLAPEFLPTEQAVAKGIYPDRGILVLEEINRVPSDTTSVLYPLLLEKKINGHSLAKGWSIGVTMNPDAINYMVNSLDDAMLDRFIAIEVIADLQDYIDYSLSNHPNDDVLSFLQAFPDMLLVVKKSAESTALSKAPTPRGWTKIQEILNRCDLKEELLRELIAGIVGPTAAATFYGYLRNKNVKLPKEETILTNYKEAASSVKLLVDNKRLELLDLLFKKILISYESIPLHHENINLFLLDLPMELRILFLKHAGSKAPDKLADMMENVPAFTEVSDQIVSLMES